MGSIAQVAQVATEDYVDVSDIDAWRHAAEQGLPEALYALGLLYSTGQGVALDYVEAHKWFNLAAMRGNDDAKRYRFEISREMSKLQISRAQRLAREWISKH